jgi:hypothetical protein
MILPFFKKSSARKMVLDKTLIYSVFKSQFSADRMVPGRQKILFLTLLFSTYCTIPSPFRQGFLPG